MNSTLLGHDQSHISYSENKNVCQKDAKNQCLTIFGSFVYKLICGSHKTLRGTAKDTFMLKLIPFLTPTLNSGPNSKPNPNSNPNQNLAVFRNSFLCIPLHCLCHQTLVVSSQPVPLRFLVVFSRTAYLCLLIFLCKLACHNFAKTKSLNHLLCQIYFVWLVVSW